MTEVFEDDRIDEVPVLSSRVRIVDEARNLGVVVDSQLSMSAQVAAVCRGGYYQLRQLRPLKRCPLDTYVISTAECERSFSVMNDILTSTKNSIKIDHLSQLVFVKCVRPPLSKFKPGDYVKSWINKRRRSADEMHCLTRS